MKRLTVEERWEQGVDHDPRSCALFDSIRKIDEQYNDDYFDWKAGGDGDNGEMLMYLLDVHFELQDGITGKEHPSFYE
jgi:hypothetical protein